MAEVVRKEPPVLIENVSLIINVYNIGHGDLSSNCGQPTDFLQNGLIDVTNCSNSTEASCSLQDSTNGLIRGQQSAIEQLPLGWIAFYNGLVIPFGLQPIALEVPTFGDKALWKEIRVCLPPSLLADNETDLYCPVSSCRERLSRNKSMDSHIKKHLGLSDKESQVAVNNGSGAVDGTLPCPLFYYCQDKKCQYYVETAEKSFKAYKNVKQHYQKVHAPRLFVCDLCQRTFSTHKVLETHKLMCGEKYSCSTCDLSYSTLEALQTHCRRKGHAYDYNKYKDKRNSVKQEMQSLLKSTPPPPATPPVPTSGGGRKSAKTARKLPALLPKTSTNQVFNSIHTFCQQAGVKVDYGCQTVCTAFLQKEAPVEALVTSTTPSFTHKKRKSTDTQTNIVKFRATGLDQKHNATNTNVDWKTVITSDSQTQTSDSCNGDTVDLPTSLSLLMPVATDSSSHFNDEFATIKISEPSNVTTTSTGMFTAESGNPKLEEDNLMEAAVSEETCTFNKNDDAMCTTTTNLATSTSTIKVDNGPSLYPEFISFLEAIDSATQTDPDMFEYPMDNECLGIRGLFDDELSGIEMESYVSVSSTASQTAVESVSTKALSAEDYEALLNTDDKKITDLNSLNEFFKTVDGASINLDDLSSESSSFVSGQGQGTNPNDFWLDWEHIVEEVYRDGDD